MWLNIFISKIPRFVSQVFPKMKQLIIFSIVFGSLTTATNGPQASNSAQQPIGINTSSHGQGIQRQHRIVQESHNRYRNSNLASSRGRTGNGNSQFPERTSLLPTRTLRRSNRPIFTGFISRPTQLSAIEMQERQNQEVLEQFIRRTMDGENWRNILPSNAYIGRSYSALMDRYQSSLRNGIDWREALILAMEGLDLPVDPDSAVEFPMFFSTVQDLSDDSDEPERFP